MIGFKRQSSLLTGDVAWARLSGGLVAAALLLSQLAGCTSGTAQSPQASRDSSVQATAVRVTEVKEGQMGAALTYTGDVKPKAQINLSSKASGRVEELTVDIGSKVKSGEVIGRLDRVMLDAQLRQAEAAATMARAKLAQMQAGSRDEVIAQAQANLDSAKEKQASLAEGGRAEAVAQAEAGLKSADARLAQLKAGPTPEQLDEAEAALRAAKNNLYAVQAQADAYINKAGNPLGPFVYTHDMKEANSGAAYEQIKVAEARLAELKAGPTKDQLDQAQAAVDQARAALDLAKNPYTEHDLNTASNAVTLADQQLQLARTPYTQNDFDVADASVAQADAAVELVKSQITDTEIVAPVDGVIADKLLSVGALASPQTPIFSIISSDLEIALSIEEARSGQISLGQPVALSVAAYPGKTFNGTVSTVAPAIDPRSRTFMVKVAVKDDEAQLKAGMFAKVSLNIGDRQSAMLVPDKAIVNRNTEPSVFVVSGGKVSLRQVDIGPGDGQNTEVHSGLKGGEKVVVEGTAGLKDGDAVTVQ